VDRTDESTSSDDNARARRVSHPGAVLVFASTEPAVRAIRIGRDPTVLGRGHAAWRGLDDHKLSREHAEVALAERGVAVRDLDSRNGTFVTGERVTRRTAHVPFGSSFRIGRSVLVAVPDVSPFEDLDSLDDGDLVVGPTMRRVLDVVRLHGTRSRTLLVRGETGAGKEVAARRFWSARGDDTDPFVAVNCATIPSNLAERLLFGAVRGAYSGAENQDGYVHAADGGVLFLDEFGDLPADVQTKLLRTLETGEVTPLGATRARAVDVRFCFATHRDLRTAVADGSFRADLYYRVALPEVVLPPLRERADEIAWLVARTCRDEQRVTSAALVDACARRPWPGNVRELIAAVRDACFTAVADHADDVTDAHLAADAGTELADAVEPGLSRGRIEAALGATGGNIAHAARALGIHRTQLYRLMSRFGLQRK
jgi:transcriptional regulator with GAF, ATPase, and Fis domain